MDLHRSLLYVSKTKTIPDRCQSDFGQVTLRSYDLYLLVLSTTVLPPAPTFSMGQGSMVCPPAELLPAIPAMPAMPTMPTTARPLSTVSDDVLTHKSSIPAPKMDLR